MPLLSSNAFCVKSFSQTLSFKSVTNRQTDKRTKKLNTFVTPVACEVPSPTELGMVMEDTEKVLALKTFEDPTHRRH